MKARKIWIGSSMPRCTFRRSHWSTIESKLKSETHSDSHDPQTATKQILAIAPILEGQKDCSQFQIPPHASKSSNSATPALPEQDTTANTAGAASSTGENTAAPVVERRDTETQEEEEFVDAEEKQ
jgi:hypothetical protein